MLFVLLFCMVPFFVRDIGHVILTSLPVNHPTFRTCNHTPSLLQGALAARSLARAPPWAAAAGGACGGAAETEKTCRPKGRALLAGSLVCTLPMTDQDLRRQRAHQNWQNVRGAYQELLSEDLENRLGDGNSHGLHGMWRCFARDGKGSQGLKNGFLDRSEGWAVGNTLVMTVAFALVALPDVQPSDTVPLSFWTHQLFAAYAFLAVVVSVRGVFEISTIQEDLAVLPPSLISEYQVAMRALRGSGLRFPGRNLGGGRDGSGCIVWTKVSLRILVSSATFLAYTIHGLKSLPWLLLLSALDSLMQTNVAHRRYRGVLWRNVEAEVWDRPENRQLWPDEFQAWQRGDNFFFMTESGWLFDDSWQHGLPEGWNKDLGRGDWWVTALTAGMLKTLFCAKEITYVVNYIFNSDRLRLNLGSHAKVLRLRNLGTDGGGADGGGDGGRAPPGSMPSKTRRVSFTSESTIAVAAAGTAVSRDARNGPAGEATAATAAVARAPAAGEGRAGADLLDLEERAVRAAAQCAGAGMRLPSAQRLPAPATALPAAVPLPEPTTSIAMPTAPPTLQRTDSAGSESFRSDEGAVPKQRGPPPGPKITLSDGRVVSGFRPMNFRRQAADTSPEQAAQVSRLVATQATAFQA